MVDENSGNGGLAISFAEAARAQDRTALRMKWTLAEVVHYDVVGEYSAPTVILAPTTGLRGK